MNQKLLYRFLDTFISNYAFFKNKIKWNKYNLTLQAKSFPWHWGCLDDEGLEIIFSHVMFLFSISSLYEVNK